MFYFQELVDLERVVARAERAIAAGRQSLENQDLYLDSAALNLHDFYDGSERIFRQMAFAEFLEQLAQKA